MARIAMALIVALIHVAAPAQSASIIRVDGSSTVFPITDAAAEAFYRSRKGAVTFAIGISGTGGGFKKFCRGDTDISNASRPILRAEMEDCAANRVRYLELPIAYDALTVVVATRNPMSAISVEELKIMWEPEAQGRISRWNQVNPAFPSSPLRLFGAGRDSGTFDYFTEAIVGAAKSSRRDYIASEDDNVLVAGVSKDPFAIGFMGFAYYVENRSRLKALAISQGGSRPVTPSLETVVSGAYQPLSRPIFIYVAEQAMEKPEVRGFVDFYNRGAAKLVRQAKYVPLPDGAYLNNLHTLQTRRWGTLFRGENKIGLTIDELLKIEARQ